MEPGLEVYQNDGDEERQSIENIEAELDPHINSVSEMSDGSDDEGTYDADDNDDTGMTFKILNYISQLITFTFVIFYIRKVIFQFDSL